MDSSPVKVYTVNGAASGSVSASALPDWLTRKRVAKKGKRAIREHFEGTIDLIQEFEFPEASNRIKTTRDGHHAVATGVYKPQMRVYDLDQLTLKFERHSDAENVDFVILSDDWTKTLLLQADRSLELHTQGGFHYRTRIPRPGRAVAYHFPSSDALVGASGPEVYRLNLSQGRFLNPLVLSGDGEDVPGVNAVDINPAHQLFAFGIEDNGTVEFWDPRARSRVGILRLPRSQLAVGGSLAPSLPGVDGVVSGKGLSVTAIASRSDGLSYAIGTSTGHTLLYDIRSTGPFALKDLGYGLAVKSVSWIEGGSRMAGDGLVLSADKKVIKIWDRNNPEGNFASITPTYDINDVHHLPGSGLIMVANEGIQMTNFYVPALGPAPRWCSFLDNITEELEDQTARSVYEDYKFVERTELTKLGLDHLVGTPALRPYMHGYFLSLRLYDAARAIARPFAYEEHRAAKVQEKLDKLAESRIRTRPGAPVPKANKALAERVRKEEERVQKHEERKKERKKLREEGKPKGEGDEEEGGEQGEEGEEKPSKATLLSDPRFAALFEDTAFEVDEGSREYALLNPSRAAQGEIPRAKTAVEMEEEESDRRSSSLSGSSSEGEADSDSGEDSSDAGDLDQYNPRARPAEPLFASAQRRPPKQPRMVAAAPRAEGRGRGGSNVGKPSHGKDAPFGQRLSSSRGVGSAKAGSKAKNRDEDDAMEISWVPSASGVRDADDMLVPGGRGKPKKTAAGRRGVETFGAGLERGGDGGDGDGRGKELSESERHGRTRRRRDVRSGSKNAFRGV